MNPNSQITLKQIEPPPIRHNYAEIFARMEIGQGFDVSERDIASLRASACLYQRNHPEWAYRTWKIETGYCIARIERN